MHPAPPATIQKKLTVNTPGDTYEQEAEQVSRFVMQMPSPHLQRACACGGTCSDCQKKFAVPQLQMSAVRPSSAARAEGPPIVHDVLRSPGQPLDSATRAFMEPRFGWDFSRVRIHSDAAAHQSAHKVNARAYTVGSNVVFAENQFSPSSHSGRSLLAHELTHVVQQSRFLSSTIQRDTDAGEKKPGTNRRHAGKKNVVAALRWTDDDWDFQDRLVSAVARTSGVPESTLPFYLNPRASHFHAEAQHVFHYRPGQIIRVRVSFGYDPDRFHPLEDVRIENASPPPVASAPVHAQPKQKTPTSDVSQSRPVASYPKRYALDTVVLWFLSDTALEIDDLNTWTFVVFDKSGDTLKVVKAGALPGTPVPSTSQQQPPSAQPQPSESEQFEIETGVPDPRKINKEIARQGALLIANYVNPIPFTEIDEKGDFQIQVSGGDLASIVHLRKAMTELGKPKLSVLNKIDKGLGIKVPRILEIRHSLSSGEKLDPRITDLVLKYRSGPGKSEEAFNRNFAAARVVLADGKTEIVKSLNVASGTHSEEEILGVIHQQIAGQKGRVDQIFSERIPCQNCSQEIIKKYFGESVDVFYYVGNIQDRPAELRKLYGL